MFLLKNILLLFTFSSVLTFNANAQNGKNKHIKKTAKLEFDRVIMQKDPELVEKTIRRTDTINISSPDGILDYFINLKKGLTHFSFWAKNNKDTVHIHVDSLIGKHKEYIDGFIERYTKQEHSGFIELTTPPYKVINDKILLINEINYKKRNRNQIDEILFLIEQLPNSRQKVLLYLAYADLNIHNKTYYADVYSYCDKAKIYVDGINDLYDKGEAYTTIGDFAVKCKINDFAIRMYYLARESFDNCNKDEKIKYREQGLLCEKLAWLFFSLNSFEQALEKEAVYLKDSYENYLKAADTSKARLNLFFAETATAILWTDFQRYKYDYNDSLKIAHAQNVIVLHISYNQFKGINNETDFLTLFAIGVTVEEKSKEIALLYYLAALPYAALGLNSGEIVACLENITAMYSALGKQDLAIKYSDLELYLVNKTNSMLAFNTALLNKALTLSKAKQFGSALLSADKFISDTSLKNIFFPSYYDQLLEEAYLVKFRALDSLKQSDSARVYERKYIGYQTAHLQYLIHLIEVESKSISDWFERSKGKEIGVKNELLKTRQKDFDILSLQKKISDSLSEINLRLSRDSTANADSILILKDSIQKKENTANAKEKDDILKNAKQKSEDDTIKNNRIYVALAVLIAAIVGFAVMMGKRRKRKFKKQTDINIAEFHRVNELAKNKIHNFRSDITDIDNLIKKNSPVLPVYMERYKEFLRIFFRNWDNQKKINLAEELEELISYYEVKKLIRDFTFDKEILIANPKEIHFLQSVFDTLLDNSIKHGFADKTGECVFTISVKREGDFIICEIIDNGIPPESNDAYFLRQNKGLNILRNRLRLMYTLLRRPYLDSYFIAKAVTNPQGTYVKLTFPYEKA